VGFTWDGLVTTPYVKAKLGPVALEAQIYYLYGEQSWEGNTAGMPAGFNTQDVDLNQLTAYIDAVVDLGMFYVGVHWLIFPAMIPTRWMSRKAAFLAAVSTGIPA